jgi:hypothetical protein
VNARVFALILSNLKSFDFSRSKSCILFGTRTYMHANWLGILISKKRKFWFSILRMKLRRFGGAPNGYPFAAL